MVVDSIMISIDEHIAKIKSRLVESEKKMFFAKSVSGLFSSLSVIVLFLFVISGSESIFYFSSTVRTFLFFIFLLFSISILTAYCLKYVLQYFYLVNQPEYENTSSFIGEYFPEIKDELKNALQLISEDSSIQSKQLTEAAFRRIAKKTDGINFNSIVNFSKAKRNLLLFLMILLSVCTFYLLVTPLSGGTERIWNYNGDYTLPAKYTFMIKPGNTNVVKNSDVDIQIRIIGPKTEKIILHTKSEEDADYKTSELKEDSTGFFNTRFRNVKSEIKYFASADNISSSIYEISVTDRPIVNNFNVTITPPSYSGLSPEVQKDNGNILALKGSGLKFDLISSKTLSRAEIVFSDSSKNKFDIAGRKAGAETMVNSSLNYYLSVTDTAGNSNQNPILYNIDILEDEYPEIKLVKPGKDEDLTINDLISLSININDDFGIGKLDLNYRLAYSPVRNSEPGFTKTPIDFDRHKSEQNVFYNWNFYPLNLSENETVEYFVEVFDNDNISGPKSARSKIYKVRVPSLDELFNSVDKYQETAEEILEKTLKNAEELKKDIEKLNQEMKKDDREISWEEKEKIEKTVEKYKDLKKEVENARDNLNKASQKMEENNLLSEETLQKYREMQNLLDNIQNEEFRNALEKLQEQMQNLLRENVQQSFENVQMDEENFKKSLERTIELLKRVQVEQKIEELLKRAEDLEKDLNELEETSKEKIDNPDSGENKNPETKQENVTQKIDNLEKSLEDLQKTMDELKSMPSEKLDKMREEFKEQSNKEKSKNTESQIRQNDFKSALQNQQQLSQNMKSFKNQMQQMQSEMQQKNQIESFMNIMNVTNDLIDLSKQQEDLKNNTEKISGSPKKNQENTKRQNQLNSDVGNIIKKLSDISKESFAITPEMGQMLGQAIKEMNSAQQLILEGSNQRAARSQQNAMAYLNQAASLLKNMMSQMMNSSGEGGGMMSMMQQLQQMSRQQMQLNQLTQMLNQGSLSQEQRAQLQKLASEQAGLQKSLEQLNREAKESGQSRQLAANLDKIIEEMKEVVNGMNTEKIDDKLVQSQERILSKLLDSQRSINERDFEKNRESRAGKQYTLKSPGELDLSDQEALNTLRDELLRAAKQGYSKDYEELIKKYFESLEKKSGSN